MIFLITLRLAIGRSMSKITRGKSELGFGELPCILVKDLAEWTVGSNERP